MKHRGWRVAGRAWIAATLLFGGGNWAGAQILNSAVPPPVGKGPVLMGRAPVAGKLSQVRLSHPRSFTLANGLRVLVLPDHRLPYVRCSLSLRAGTVFSTRPGVAGLTAAMLGEGTRARTSDQIAQALEDLGLTLTATADGERVTLTGNGLAAHVELLLTLLADEVLNSTFPAERLARVQFQEQGRATQQRGNPRFLARNLTTHVLYGDSPYARETPPPGEIAAIRREDVVAFHQRFYRPNGAILGITGDVDPRAVLVKVQGVLGEWAPAAHAAELPRQDFTRQSATRVHLMDRPGAAQTTLHFGTIAIARTDPDYVPLMVANRILGGDFSARLMTNLREDKGYSYAVGSTLTTPPWPGQWTANAAVQTPVTELALKEFLLEFGRLVNEPVPEAELERVKQAMVGGIALTSESPAGVLQRTMELAENGLPPEYWDTFPATVQAVTAADVLRVARKYLGEGQIQIIAIGERAKIEDALRKYGSVAVYDTDFLPVTAR